MSTMDAAVYAKIKAMQGRRLTDTDYQELLRCRSVGEIAGYLKHSTGYIDALTAINENTIHRGQLEQLLRRSLMDEYERIVHYTNSDADEYYSYFLIKNEVEQILSFIRYLHSGMASEYAVAMPSYLVGKLSIDLYAMARCTSLRELADLMKQTRYGSVLHQIYNSTDEGDFTIVQVETELITFYYNEVLRMLDISVHGVEKEELRGFYMQRAEMYNIVTAARAKEYFALSPEKIKPMLLPFRAKLRSGFFDAFVTKNREEMRAMIENSAYAWLIENYQCDTLDEYRTWLEFELCRRFMRISFEGGSIFTAHIGLRETELKNIVHIIEGVRYGMLPERIEKLLIGYKVS